MCGFACVSGGDYLSPEESRALNGAEARRKTDMKMWPKNRQAYIKLIKMKLGDKQTEQKIWN